MGPFERRGGKMDDWETLSVQQRAVIDAPDEMDAWGDWVAKAQTGQKKVTIGRRFRAVDAWIVRSHGHHYLAKPKVNNRRDRDLLGFGGRDWEIRFLDGEVIETNNLWHQGEIPLALRSVLPDNAEFIGRSHGFDTAPKVQHTETMMEVEMLQLSRYPHNYRRVLKFLTTNIISDDEYDFDEEEHRPKAPITEAHVVGSRITEGPRKGMHTLIIDVDHPTRAPRSTNFDHHHLYIDYPMPWEDVVKVLTVLAEVGIVEPGYVQASIDRGETNVRLPWILKHEDFEQFDYIERDGKRQRADEPLDDETSKEWPF